MGPIVRHGAALATRIAYIFVDGGYVRRRFCEAIRVLFPDLQKPVEYLDPSALLEWKDRLGVHECRRVFYYDCVWKSDAATPCDGLSPAQAKCFEAMHGVHVAAGRLAGKGEEPRQKGVDVQLAVDTLSHSYLRNITDAVLMAGDSDFTPLVEALVRQGVFVTLLCEARHTASDLRRAADVAVLLRASDWHKMALGSFRSENPLPHMAVSTRRVEDLMSSWQLELAANLDGGRTAHLLHGESGEFQIFVPGYDPAGALQLISRDPGLLKRFFAAQFEPNTRWEPAAPGG